MNILDFLKNNILFLDGGMGTLLQKKGLLPGELPERWNISHADIISSVHRDYFDAGSNVVCANTFGANSLKFDDNELEKIIKCAIQNARNAIAQSNTSHPKWVALDIGPTGRMLKPYGDMDFEDAVNVFSKTVKLGAKYGADLVFIETMNDSYETKAAVLAAKENCSLPVFVSNAYGEDQKLMTGAAPHAMVAMLEGLGADAIGVNCSLGPKALGGVVREYLKYSSLPVILKPNAGLPKAVNGNTVYDILPDEFSLEIKMLINEGVRIAGGCCGTTPDYIKATVKVCENITPLPITDKNISVVSSHSHAVIVGGEPVLIGERINPTGKKRFKEALIAHDIDYILTQGLEQQQKGAHILDVNVGLPEINEKEMLTDTVCALQAIINAPLQIDTSDPDAMESALRKYNGKAMINSVSGKKEVMDAVFPLAKKYGGVIVALTLDEKGIPDTADKRIEIAENILKEAKKYGISQKDIIFDSLALTVSADNNAAVETLKAIKGLSDMGYNTSLGVSNVSFGLPCREIINSTFFTMALTNGLKAAIINPNSDEMIRAYKAFCALAGFDRNCESFIEFSSGINTLSADSGAKNVPQESSDLQQAIAKGLKDSASLITKKLITQYDANHIIQNEIIPALNTVGVGFENKTVFLPQLLMSAEAAKSAFEVIKSSVLTTSATKCSFVLATVKGDIHDIGKNIVKLLLENYGFDVTDLGKDVPPEKIVSEVIKLHAPIVGLSALMTTTVPAMQETILQLRKNAPWCKVVVGGAVLTQEYADAIGADKYAKDAMETVRFSEQINREQQLSIK